MKGAGDLEDWSIFPYVEELKSIPSTCIVPRALLEATSKLKQNRKPQGLAILLALSHT